MNKNLILDYSYPNFQNYSSGIDGGPLEQDGKYKNCPYCKTTTHEVYSEKYNKIWEEPWNRTRRVERDGVAKIYACACGWWITSDLFRLDQEWPEMGYTTYKEEQRISLLKEFEAIDLDTPLDELITYASKKPEILRDINPTKFELLVGSTLGHAFNCQVSHCGRTGDGGIDLYLLDSDSPLLIQVKRREKPSTEGVQVIRELIGASLLQQENRAAVVTTAVKFSRGAELTAQKAVNLGLLKEFILIDFDKFSKILNIVSTSISPPWEKYALHQIGPNLSLDRLYVS